MSPTNQIIETYNPPQNSNQETGVEREIFYVAASAITAFTETVHNLVALILNGGISAVNRIQNLFQARREKETVDSQSSLSETQTSEEIENESSRLPLLSDAANAALTTALGVVAYNAMQVAGFSTAASIGAAIPAAFVIPVGYKLYDHYQTRAAIRE